jgi:hypothetical protein
MQFPAPAAVSGSTIIVAAYEAMFARIGDLGGGVLSDLIGSPGLPEMHVHIHPVELCQVVSALFFCAFGVFVY